MSRTRWIVAAAIIGSAAVNAAADDRRYTLDDLKALRAHHAWSELIVHLADIPPTKRDAGWQQLAVAAATGTVDAALTTDNALDGIVASEALLESFPELRGATEFMAKRAQNGLRAFEGCFAEPLVADRCGPALLVFVARDPDNLDLAFAAGKLARVGANAAFSTPMFARGLARRAPSRTCSDPDVALATFAALALPADRANGDAIHAAQRIAGDECFAELRDGLLDQLRAGDAAFAANACPVLKARHAASRRCGP